MKRPLVIAHRGACGYLPDHTLEAKALAFGMGADYLEQDIVASRDGELLVLHDVILNHMSDVAEKYPDRARADGNFFVCDFDLAELRTLCVFERFRETADEPVFPGRFPAQRGNFRVVTLREELEFIAGLQKSTGRKVGIYPEIKRPAFYRSEGIDLATGTLNLLAEFGYSKRTDPVYFQCFDPAELRRVRLELGSDLKLIQLIDENNPYDPGIDYTQMVTGKGLDDISAYADGIGPWVNYLYTPAGDGARQSRGLVEMAHARRLAVHPWTFRSDALPPGFTSFAELVHWAIAEEGVDGLFTDFPDKTLAIVNLLAARKKY
jgi:glycerophosphoryl diester phosphodiesterase